MRKLLIYLNNKTNVNTGLAHDLLQAREAKDDNIFDAASKWLLEAKANDFKMVMFSGGEPTLEFEKLINLIKQAKSLDLYTSLKTNGWFAENEKSWVELQESGLDFFRLTYDSDFFYQGSPLTKDISLKAIKEGKERFKMFAIITDDSERDIAELRDTGCIIEIIPNTIREGNYKVNDLMNFVIDFRGRVFTQSSGIFYAENTGTLDDRYLGSLEEGCRGCFGELFEKFKEKSKLV